MRAWERKPDMFDGECGSFEPLFPLALRLFSPMSQCVEVGGSLGSGKDRGKELSCFVEVHSTESAHVQKKPCGEDHNVTLESYFMRLLRCRAYAFSRDWHLKALFIVDNRYVFTWSRVSRPGFLIERLISVNLRKVTSCFVDAKSMS